MKNLEDQLKQLPSEFIVEMENQKKERWIDVYNYIIDYFGIGKDIMELNESGFDFVDFMKKIHDLGFYGGINFALDPQETYTHGHAAVHPRAQSHRRGGLLHQRQHQDF